MTRVILVRHCEAQGNTDGTFQGRTDCDISGNGETQLELVALRCRNMPIDVIYSSPLKRAYRTAEADSQSAMAKFTSGLGGLGGLGF